MTHSSSRKGGLAVRIRRITVLSRLIVAATVLWVAAQIVVTVAVFERGESWVAAYKADVDSDPVLGGYKTWALGELVVMIVAWVLTSAWLWQVRTNAELVEPDSQDVSRSQLVTGWIVPVFMLWTPYQAVSDAAVPTVRVTRGRAAASDLPVLLRLWWGSYLAMLLAILLPHGYTLGTYAHLPAIRNLSLVAVGVTLVSAVLWVRVVGTVTAAQTDVQVLAEAVETVRQAEAARQ
jgi:hypothetical protein